MASQDSINLFDELFKLRGLDLTKEVKHISEKPFAGGGYSDVHKGLIKENSRHRLRGKTIVVRFLRCRQGVGEIGTVKNLTSEMNLWCRVKHKNCLPLEGYYMKPDRLPALITEYMESGTVLQYVMEKRTADLRLLAHGIAEGVRYLHSSGIVHADLKSSNVLVHYDGTPLVCDFGLSRIVSKQDSKAAITTSTGLQGSVRWMARELIEETEGHTVASDVWAYGMTLLELMTKRPPYNHVGNDIRVIVELLLGRIPERPASILTSHNHLWDICRKCWDLSPGARPTMQNIISLLKEDAPGNDSVDFRGAGSAVFRYAMSTVSNSMLPGSSFLMQRKTAESPDVQNAKTKFLEMWKEVPLSKVMKIKRYEVNKNEDLIAVLGSNHEDNRCYVILVHPSTAQYHRLARRHLLPVSTPCTAKDLSFELMTIEKFCLMIAFTCSDRERHTVVINWQTGRSIAIESQKLS